MNVLHTDASQKGLGAVLNQNQDGKLQGIGYGSLTLTPEQNYHYHYSGKLEFMALKWAVCDKFRDYLFYAPYFNVFTDNNPLTYILSTAKLNAVGLRWVGQQADFHFDIRYRPGKTNIDANTLSLLPLDLEASMVEYSERLSEDAVCAFEFENQLFGSLRQLSSVGNPAERLNCTLLQMLRTIGEKEK